MSYKLFRNQGSGTYDFIELQSTSYSYTTDGLQAVIDTTTESLTLGEIYSFYTVAINENGQSQESEYLYVGVADYPVAPTSITKVAD